MNVSIFVGIPLDTAWEQAVDPICMQLYGHYLHPLTHEGTPYLGKAVEGVHTLEELEHLTAHVTSLLNCIAPSRPLTECLLLSILPALQPA